MASINKAIILGRLGKDPELKATPNGQFVCKFSIATSEKFKDKETTEWHNIVVWGKSAESSAKYLKKGSMAYVEGRIQSRSWEKDGQKFYATDIIASAVQFLSPKTQNEESQIHSLTAPSAEPATVTDFGDDLPF
jgi:single-strand DNA-binding protein